MAPRINEVKALFDDDEFRELKQECVAADVKHSAQLRTLAKAWIAEQKDKRRRQQTEWPNYGQNMAMSLPSRSARPIVHMRR